MTGATRELGRALVNELSRRDHEVVATGRRLADMADLQASERLVLDRRNLPLRVPVGLRSERLVARVTPSLLGRLVRSPYKW